MPDPEPEAALTAGLRADDRTARPSAETLRDRLLATFEMFEFGVEVMMRRPRFARSPNGECKPGMDTHLRDRAAQAAAGLRKRSSVPGRWRSELDVVRDIRRRCVYLHGSGDHAKPRAMQPSSAARRQAGAAATKSWSLRAGHACGREPLGDILVGW
jgi:hypothetical protein